MMLRCVIVCLLLRVFASAPLSSDTDPWSASSSDEDPQLPAVFPVVGGAPQQAPPSLIMEVKDTETNLTLSFAIFILPEEEEGSAMDRGGRSDDSSSDDVSSEEYSSQHIQPITVLHASEQDDGLMVSETERPLSEEMMNDQPVLDEFSNTFNRKSWDQGRTLSVDSDSLNKNTETNPPPAGVTVDPGNERSDSRQPGTFGAKGVSPSSSKDLSSGLNFRGGVGSIQEVMDLLSGSGGTASHHKGHGSTPDSVTVRQVGLGLGSEESAESLETLHFRRVSPDTDHPSSLSPDPDRKGSPKAIPGLQSSSDPSLTLTYDLISPGSDSTEVLDTYKGSSLNPVSPGQDVPPVVLKVPKQTIGLTSDSSEEGPLGLTSPGPGLSKAGSPEDSSSSEEVLFAIASLQTESDSSESGDQTPASDSGSELGPPDHGPGNDSQSAELLPDPDLELSPGLETNFSSTSRISQDESEESQTSKTPGDANTTGGRGSASIASSSGVSMEDADADVSTDKDPAAPTYTTSPPSETVISGASSDAITDTGSDMSAEEEDASRETDTADLALNMKPTAPTGYITHPPYYTDSADANANTKERGSDVYTQANTEANSLSQNQPASRGHNTASPPRRKEPYRFGSLGPINYSHNNQPASLVTRGRFRARQQPRYEQRVHSGQLHTFFKGHYNSGRGRYNSGRGRYNSGRGRYNSGRGQPFWRLTRVSKAKAANSEQSSSEED